MSVLAYQPFNGRGTVALLWLVSQTTPVVGADRADWLTAAARRRYRTARCCI